MGRRNQGAGGRWGDGDIVSLPHFGRITRQNYQNNLLKVAFIQKVMTRLSYLQLDEPNYFPELEIVTFQRVQIMSHKLKASPQWQK